MATPHLKTKQNNNGVSGKGGEAKGSAAAGSCSSGVLEEEHT